MSFFFLYYVLVNDEFFRCLLERIAGREVIHNYSKGVMPVKPLMKP